MEYKFMGYSRKSVDTYLNSLIEEHNAKVSDINNKIIQLERSKSELLDKINNLNIEIQNVYHKSGFIEAARERVAKVAQLLEESAHREIQEILSSAKMKLPLYESKINKIKEDTNNLRQHFNLLLGNIFEVLDDEYIKKLENEKDTQHTMPELNYISGDINDNQVADSKLKPENLSVPMEWTSKPKREWFWGEDNDVEANTEEKDTEANSSEHKEPDLIKKSDAISKDINTIKLKYIVGKIAGDDLMANDGEVIIRKNEEITVDVVQKAEQESKLSELIINMMLPDLD